MDDRGEDAANWAADAASMAAAGSTADSMDTVERNRAVAGKPTRAGPQPTTEHKTAEWSVLPRSLQDMSVKVLAGPALCRPRKPKQRRRELSVSFRYYLVSPGISYSSRRGYDFCDLWNRSRARNAA